MTTLSADTAAALVRSIAAPGYDRGRVSVGVVHVGVGGFHRAHQAVYFDRLMRETGQLEWGICGVGLLEGDRAMQEVLEAQDNLFTVVERHGDGTRGVRIVRSIVDYLFSPDDPDAVVERMAGEGVRIVSLTITEGAYRPDPEDVDLLHDLDSGEPPRTVFGLICEALRRRRDRGLPPFTVVSCDNVPGNGQLARKRVADMAHRRDPDLAGWIEHEVRFPSSMVDRITPATTDRDRQELAELHGISDRWPVVCEPYSQWVLEDSFSAGRPPLEKVGVQLVHDVRPYELMKLRLLNGSHQVLCYLAYLSGHRTVHQAVRDRLFRLLLLGYMNEEATPTLEPVPGIDLGEYKNTLIERFSNPYVGDTVARLCAYGSDRLAASVLPVIREQLETGGEIRHAMLALAGWARYAEGVDEDGGPIDVVDRRGDLLTDRARRQRIDPEAFIQDRELFGDLVDDRRFVTAFREGVTSLHQHGARATVASLAVVSPG